MKDYMTTVAWDGTYLAADTLSTDNWGLKGHANKILEGENFILGIAGPQGLILAWWRQVQSLPASSVIAHGYTHYEREHNNPSMILVTAHKAYKLDGPVFIELEEGEKVAIGSGRDFAMAAMYLGKEAGEAVLVAAHFDVNTNNRVQVVQRPAP